MSCEPSKGARVSLGLVVAIQGAVDEAPLHNQWAGNRLYFFPPATEYVVKWISSFREFPPRAKPGTFGLSQVMEAMTAPSSDNK